MLILNSDTKDPMDPDHRNMSSEDQASALSMEQYKNDAMDWLWRKRGRTKSFGLSGRARLNFDRIKWNNRKPRSA